MSLNFGINKKVTEERLNQPEYQSIENLGDKRPILRGIEEAREVISKARSGRILVYFDPDVDGIIAGLFYCLVLQREGKAFNVYANSNRAHGFLLDPDEYEGWTVFNGDFLVPRSIVRDMVESGASILSTDHHELEDGDENHFIVERGVNGEIGVVVNNQYTFEDQNNLFQSGAGVTFELLRELYPWLDTPTNRALVGITLLTDIRDIQNEKAAGYLHELYNHKYSGFIKYLISATKTGQDYGFGIPRADRNFVDYVFGPAINAMLRYNEEDEALKFILGQGYPKREYRKEQRQFVLDLLEVSKKYEYEHLTVIEIDENQVNIGERSYYTNFIGLLCSRYTGNGKSVLGYSRDHNGRVTRASFRGNLQNTPYRENLESLIDGRGHSIAFGVLGLKPSEELFEKINTVCGESEKDSTFTQRYIEVRNLRSFANNGGAKLAELNSYLMSANRIFIRYTGSESQILREGAAYRVYTVNGREVLNFNLDLSLNSDYILAIYDRNEVKFYLQEAFDESLASRVSLEDINLGAEWYKELDRYQ